MNHGPCPLKHHAFNLSEKKKENWTTMIQRTPPLSQPQPNGSTNRKKNMYRLLPADYCDRQTGRCRISPGRFQHLGLSVGQWVVLQSTLHAEDQIYCRVWPARYDCQDAILADRSIARGAPSEYGLRIREQDRYGMSRHLLVPMAQKRWT